jgi:alkylation response protein AidB-like acyl-CoA dehydrogenase
VDFRLSEDQLIVQKEARDFLSKECTREVVREAFEGPDGDSAVLYKKMAELGWLGFSVPEEHGGLGQGLVEQAVLVEQLGYFDAPGTYFSTACLAIPTLLALGATDLVAPLLDGSTKATVVTDPEFVLDGQLADAFVVIRNDLDKVLWVQRSEAEVVPHTTIDGTRRTATVKVPEGVGRELGKVGAVEKAIDAACALLCAESTGGMQRVLDMTLEYAKSRTQFDRPVGSFQVVKHRLADALVKTESSRSASYYAAWANGAGADDAAFSSSVAKAYVSDAYLWVAGEGIQLHGGIGYTWEHDAHLWFKRATMNAVLLGESAFHRERALNLSLSTR